MAFLLSILIASVLCSKNADCFEFDFAKHICGVCEDMKEGFSCMRYGACGHLHESSFQETCAAHCPKSSSKERRSIANELDVRVTKGFGTKSYDQVRISVVTSGAREPATKFFDYSKQFQYKWTDKYLHTAMKSAQPGHITSFSIGRNFDDIKVFLPAQGEGAAGVLIADPCMQGGSITSLVGCWFGKKFQTYNRTVEMINAFVADESTDFWGIFGDNFYDRTGEITTDVFSRISLDAKAKLFMSVAGNHDYWVLGSPSVATIEDQCGNGYMQFYAQDSKAAEYILAGNSSPPFDFSVHPRIESILGCREAAMSNFFWYNQIGNIGIVGQSGAYAFDDVKPFMREACTWLSRQSGLSVALLIGHWDLPGLGASPEMAMPQWYTEMAALPGCKEFDDRGMLKFVMGHTHCNDPHPHGKIGTGFRVAGFGMEGCGNYGMPLIDTTGGRVRFWYFDTSSDDKFAAALNCVRRTGWRRCTHLALLWIDQPISRSPAAVVV